MKPSDTILFRAFILVFVLLTLIFLSFALFASIGMLIGGNFFQTFEAFGVRGYEATGVVGGIIGILLGLVADYFIIRYLKNILEKKKGKIYQLLSPVLN